MTTDQQQDVRTPLETFRSAQPRAIEAVTNGLRKATLVPDRSIVLPILQVVGEYDNLVRSEASKPFNDVVGTDDVSTIEYPSGHVGLATSNGAHRDLWPEVAEWFLEHSEQPTLADVLGDGSEDTLDVETAVTVGDVSFTPGLLQRFAEKLDHTIDCGIKIHATHSETSQVPAACTFAR